ncbi:uncharacterized protein [Montipora foliosa]|uniref:uncharacterized protein isoform X3 n=2 Tax=Montipora foliosa TaxID=591990 RepID=UPI0035F14EBA
MSSIGYGGLLYEVSQVLKDPSKISKILFAAQRAKLIAEDSESYNARFKPGDNGAELLTKLCTDMEEESNLGIDNLGELRDLLKQVKAWGLIAKVDKFVRQRKDYTSLLDKIICQLDSLDCLNDLISLCADHIPEEVKKDIKDTRKLFCEVEKKNRLGVGRLALLKKILKEKEEQDLLDEVLKFEDEWRRDEDFERRRDQATEAVKTVIVAPASSLYSGVKQLGEQIVGGLKMVCKFTTLGGVSLTLGMVGILNKASRGSLEEFTNAFTTAILPGASKLLSIGDGSVCFTLQAENRSALKELWDGYQDGSLRRSLQEFLVTDDIRQTADGEEVEVTVYIDEQEYNDACLSLFLAEKQALSKNDPAAPIKRPRRNSESVIHVKSDDNAQTLFYESLRLQEAKFYQEKINRLEEEIKRLKRQIEEARGIAGSELTSPPKRPIKSLGTEDIERRPRKRRRRNSDSNLYVNAKGEMENREVEQHRFLERDKHEFVRQYLENIHEARSITTETSDSGIKTYGAPSEHQTEDIPEITPSLYFKDLTGKERMGFCERVVLDLPACKAIGRSFGFFHGPFPGGLISIMLDSFPYTPVKMLLDVVEALHLYDLVDLLNQAMSSQRPVRSLHLALTLDEISILRNPENRPASYHSKAAVLIFTEDEHDASVKQVAKFFKHLDNGSEVTIIPFSQILNFQIYQKAKETFIHWSNCQAA